MKIIIVISVVLLAAVSYASGVFPIGEQFDSVHVKTPGGALSVEVADTPLARQKGLSGREGFGEEDALLFVFDTPGRHGIWMKDMRFPIDIVWMDEEGEVIKVERRVSPDTYPEVFQPATPAQYVLEMQAGASTQYGIAVGSVLEVAL